MNTSTFVWFLLAVQLVKSKGESDVRVKDSSTSAQLDDLVAEYRSMDPPKADLFIDATSAVEVSHNPISMRVIQDGLEHPANYQLKTSSILIFDSVENFKEHVRSIYWVTNKRFRHPHLVYIPGVTLNDILEHIDDGFSIDHVGFLVHAHDGSIELATSFMYTKEKCRTNQLVTINRFTNTTVGWENTTFYPEKYNDFHGCSLTVTSNQVITDLEDLFDGLAKELNVILQHSTEAAPDNDKSIDLLGANGQFDGDNDYITSDIFGTTDLLWLVPPGEPYSQFEKMFLPFDAATWILICLTFLLAIITVQALKLFPMKVQNFVFGRNFRYPTLNIFDIFLNGGQRIVPGRNFSRYLLTLFTIWCLIIRTCYQSKTFEFLQADMRKPGPTSLQDMGYTEEDNTWGLNYKQPEDDYVPTKYGEPMNRTKFAICLGDVVNNSEKQKECLTIIADPENKAFAMAPTYWLIRTLNSIGLGNPSFVILDNKMRTFFAAIKFKTFCPFYQTFNQKIGYYITSGIPQKWTDSKHKPKRRGLTWKDEEMGPRVLTLDDLQIGFAIHLVCLGISTVVFFLELLPIMVKNFVRKLIMLNVLVAYFRNLLPRGTEWPQNRLVKKQRRPLKPKTKFIKVKPKSPSNSRVQLEIHSEITPKAKNSNPKLDVKDLLLQCPTGIASSFRLVNLQAESSTREVGTEEFGSLETSIDDEFGPRPEVQTVECRALPLTLLEDGRGGFIDISDLVSEDDWEAAGFSPLRKAL